MVKLFFDKKWMTLCVLTLSLQGFSQEFSLGGMTLNAYHSTFGSYYATENGFIPEVGYHLYFGKEIFENTTVNAGFAPSVIAQSYSIIEAYIPVSFGINYGKNGFDHQVPSLNRFGLFTNIYVGPTRSFSQTAVWRILATAEAGLKFRFRGRDMAVGVASQFSVNNPSNFGVRVSYALPPFE